MLMPQKHITTIIAFLFTHYYLTHIGTQERLRLQTAVNILFVKLLQIVDNLMPGTASLVLSITTKHRKKLLTTVISFGAYRPQTVQAD